MRHDEVGQLFIRSLHKIILRKGDLINKVDAQMDLLIDICKAAVQDTGIHFHTLFSLIAFTGHRHNFPRRLIYNIHRFRKQIPVFKAQKAADTDWQALSALGTRVASDMIRIVFNANLPPSIHNLIPDDGVLHYPTDDVVQFKKKQRVLVIEKREAEEVLIAIDQARADLAIKIKYNLPDRNEDFTDSIQHIGSSFPLPLELNLIDVEIDREGLYFPKAFIIEPDYLVDVTSIAEASKERTSAGAPYLLKKFLPVVPNKYLMLGHIANFFLDELMANSDLEFRDLIHRVFALNPIAFCLFDDSTAREIVQSAQRHFVNLRMVIKQTLPKHGIKVVNCFLEPTFYSEQYGLQGRLDVLHDDPNIADDAAIIELKSGRPFRPNVYGLSHNHYIQTLLYDLLIKSVSEDKLRPTNYILYSGMDKDHLRFAPAVRSQQYHALAVRNQLVAVDHWLAESNEHLRDPEKFLSIFDHAARTAGGFLHRDIELFRKTYRDLTRVEQKYFISMVGLIAREHHLAKVGVEGESRNRGQAALWLNTLDSKESDFDIISHLNIERNDTQEQEPIITLQRTELTNPLANFRKGDLAILYPLVKDRSPLSTQLFKGTIIHIDQHRVQVRLRAKQFNDQIFKAHNLWNIEHDSLDSSFISQHRALFSFCSFDRVRRHKFLTIKPPSPPQNLNWKPIASMTSEQNAVMQKIISAPDYFLLWGPPGTGKTSIMLKHLVAYLMENSEERILLIAYTNRAVDEICHALEEISDIRKHYLRIGSRYSTDPAFCDQLLFVKMSEVQTREALRSLLESHRIVVGTASSIVGKSELFDLISFDRIIVDEATQMLEPMMAGLLPRFNKVVLIGDHRQLAAVVVQSRNERYVNDADLRAIGIADLGDSYFERAYRRCRSEGWDWAFSKLTYQGRMHQDIMEFPRDVFYEGTLKTLPSDNGKSQQEALSLVPGDDSSLSRLLSCQRVIFVPVSSRELYSSKTNAAEAQWVVRIIESLTDIYRRSKRDFSLSDLGVITPFRAQIAKIRDELSRTGLNVEQMTIDTVERFQGGARKIIIISLCVNSPNQLNTLLSISSDGVDRRLNVALTRAKEQLILIGDPEVLSSNEIYRSYIEKYRVQVT